MATYTSAPPPPVGKVWKFSNQAGATLNVRLSLGSSTAPAALSLTVNPGALVSNAVTSTLQHFVRIYASAATNAATPLASCGPISPGIGFTVKAVSTKTTTGTKYTLSLV